MFCQEWLKMPSLVILLAFSLTVYCAELLHEKINWTELTGENKTIKTFARRTHKSSTEKKLNVESMQMFAYNREKSRNNHLFGLLHIEFSLWEISDSYKISIDSYNSPWYYDEQRSFFCQEDLFLRESACFDQRAPFLWYHLKRISWYFEWKNLWNLCSFHDIDFLWSEFLTATRYRPEIWKETKFINEIYNIV